MNNDELNWHLMKEESRQREIWGDFLVAVQKAEKSKKPKQIKELRLIAERLAQEYLYHTVQATIWKKIEQLEEEAIVEDNNTLGNYIKHEREARGLTLAALAEISGVSASYINRIEKGERKSPSIDIIENLSIALETPVASFMNISKPRYHKAISLSQLIYENVVTLKNGSFPLSAKKKERLLELVEFLGDMKWKENKHMEMLDLIDLLDRFYEE